jgi:hypothetical protein
MYLPNYTFPIIRDQDLFYTNFLLSVTPPISPPIPPPLLPRATIKLRLAQLPVNLIVRPTHPQPELLTPAHSRLILRPAHPILEVLRANPARIQLGEQGEELTGFGLQG